MALINCSISTGSVTATAGTTNLATQTLVITPNHGYVVSAAAFANNTASNSSVNSITLANSTTANAVGNVVNVLVDFTNSFAMPSVPTALVIDIDGRAIFPDAKLQSVGGTWDAVVGAGVTPTTSSGTTYSAEGLPDTTTTLFTQAFTCSSGKFFTTTPSVVITTGDAVDYNIQATNGYTGVNGVTYHTSVTYVVSYTFPAYGANGNNIDFTIPASQVIPVRLNQIVSYSIPTTAISSYGESRSLKVHGTVEGTFNCSITNEDNHFYNFTTTAFQSGSTNQSQTISEDGFVLIPITFPAVGDDDTYTITFTATGSTSLSLTQTHPIVIQQLSQKSITWSTATALGRSYTALPTQVVNNNVGEIIASRIYQPISLTVTDNVAFKLYRAPSLLLGGLITNTNIGENATTQCDVVVDKITTVPAYSSGMAAVTSMVITMANEQYWQGTNNGVLQLNLDQFINIPPTAAAQSSIAVANNTAKTIQLVGNSAQHNNSTLTYSIVSAPTKGAASVVANTGVATYTPTSSSSAGHDSFTYKVNDGTEDSPAATIAVVVAVAGGGGGGNPTMTSVYSWNDSEVNSNYSIITSAAFKGTGLYNNSLTSGSSSFKANMTSWSLDSTHTSVPAYIDNLGDYSITWKLKYLGSVVAQGDAGISSGISSFNQGARTATLGVTEVTVAVPNSHNSGNGLIGGGSYQFDWLVKYDNISQ